MASSSAAIGPSDGNMSDAMDVDPGPSTAAATVRYVVPPDEPMPRASSLPPDMTNKTYQVGYVYSTKMMMHSCAHGHCEQPERISFIHDILNRSGCLARMKKIPIRRVIREEALLVHSQSLWDKVIALHTLTEQDIADSEAYYSDLSLYVHPSTPFCAMLSAGGVIEAAMHVAEGRVKKSFAIVRPPGHHAEPDEHMGFCFFNNVSIAAKVVQMRTPLKRILILDWDVHHGNGTQRTFNDDPSVLYISLHRFDNGTFYPNGPFGSMTSCGVGAGLGYSVNIPWPEGGMGDADYLLAFQKVIMPIALEFAPELVIISAGFDAADGDELGECFVTPAGYAHMTYMLCSLADGKLVVALEGGYSLEAISNSALAVTKVILGEVPPMLPTLTASEVGTETVWAVAQEQSKYWKNVDPRASDPMEDIEPLAITIPELLKAHRQQYLYREHGMLQVPMLNQSLVDRFDTQVACTTDLMENDTLVVFVHELGNLRVELDSAMYSDVRLEHSYMVDCSKALLRWVKLKGYGLLDINLFAKPTPEPRWSSKSKQQERQEINHSAQLMVYLWDNYVQISAARKVVLIGHGPGCEPVMRLIGQRASTVMKSVQGVVQVVGLHDLPSTPRDMAELRKWYFENSLVVVPSNHPVRMDPKILKKYGNILEINEDKTIKLILRAMRSIQLFIEAKLGPGEAAPAAEAVAQ